MPKSWKTDIAKFVFIKDSSATHRPSERDSFAKMRLYRKRVLVYKDRHFIIFRIYFQSLFVLEDSDILDTLDDLELDLETLLPHRGRMKLLERIVQVGDRFAVTEAVVANTWPLVENGAADPLVLIELVAQTSAVCIGWKKLAESGGDEIDARGLLAGVKEASFSTDRIPVDTRITTRTQVNFNMDNFTEIMGWSEADDKILGEIVLQVVKEETEGLSV